jgi:hypothetical protein
MKWTFVIQQKLKVALLLGVIMCVVVLFNLVLQKNISDINQSVNSIYNDRLIPATDIFHLSENLHSKQTVLEKFLYQNSYNASELEATLQASNIKIGLLINKYEKTYLVDEESVFLKNFKKSIADFSTVEQQMLSLSKAGGKAEALRLYERQGRGQLEATIIQLSDLNTIQSAVGGKLVSDTKGIVATSNFLSNLQMVLAIIIGVMITSLVVSSKIISQSQAKFKWN